MNVMTILVAEKDCILQGLSFVIYLNMVALSHRRPASIRESYHTCCVQESNKRNTVLNLILVMSIISNKIMQWLIKQYLPKLLHTQLSSYFLAFCNDASVCCVPQ